MCNIGNMTFIFEPNLAIIKANMHGKNEDVLLKHSSVIMLTERHTERYL